MNTVLRIEIDSDCREVIVVSTQPIEMTREMAYYVADTAMSRAPKIYFSGYWDTGKYEVLSVDGMSGYKFKIAAHVEL